MDEMMNERQALRKKYTYQVPVGDVIFIHGVQLSVSDRWWVQVDWEVLWLLLALSRACEQVRSVFVDHLESVRDHGVCRVVFFDDNGVPGFCLVRAEEEWRWHQAR